MSDRIIKSNYDLVKFNSLTFPELPIYGIIN